MKKIKYLALALVAFVMSSAIFGCSEDESNPMTPVSSTAQVMVTHASPDAPGVDLLVDGTVVGTNLVFPNSTSYVNVNSGTRNIKVNVTGTSTTVINADVPFEKDKVYSVFAVDSVSNLSAVLTNDGLTAPASGKSHVRFLHLSPNAPAVDVAVTGGPVLFSNRTFNKSVTSTEMAFTPVDAGSYNLEVRLAGTSTVVLSLPGINLENGKIYTVFAKGLVGGTGMQALGAQIIVNK